MKQRIIAKRDRDSWGVYDTVRASWPEVVAGFGRVRQRLAEEQDAVTEAMRLEKFYAAHAVARDRSA